MDNLPVPSVKEMYSRIWSLHTDKYVIPLISDVATKRTYLYVCFLVPMSDIH